MTLPPASLTAAALDVKGVDFAYPGGKRVFSDFSVSVARGEFVALLGPSGCGKSTLLNLLSGFLQPQRGQVRIDGQPARPEHPSLGYVFQSPQLFPWLSARENVRFGLRMRGAGDTQQQRQAAQRYLELVGLGDVGEALPNTLSGGMQQRVSLARTLALEPRVLLMDEPFAALDAITRAQMNEETLRLWSTLGQSVVFITHDIDEAVFLADRVVVLSLAPFGIHSEQAIDLPRPRDNLSTRALPAFHHYRELLSERIAEVMRAA